MMRSPIGRSRAQVEDGGGAVGAVEDFTTGAGTSAGDDDDDEDEAEPFRLRLGAAGGDNEEEEQRGDGL